MPYLPPASDPNALTRRLVVRSQVHSAAPAAWTVASGQQHGSPLLEYWQVIRGNFAWIGTLALVGLAVGWLVATLERPLYQAKVTLDIRSLNASFLDPRDTSSAGATDSVLPESYIQTELRILQSDSIQRRALAKIPIPPDMVGRRPDPSFFQSPLEWLRPKVSPMKDLVADAGNRIKVRAVGNTRIVDIFCAARDGQLAATVCNTVAKTYIENNTQSRYTSTKETSDWLQSQLDDVRKRLTKSENDLNDAAKATDLGMTSEMRGDNPIQDKLRQLQSELSRAQADRILKDTNYAIASTQSVDTLPSEMDSGPIREYRLRLADLQRQLAEAKATMTPEHYRVRELTMQVADAERRLEKERNSLVSRLKTDLEASLHREGLISDAYSKQAKQASQREDKAVHYNMIKREVDSERQLYGSLLQKVDEVGLAAALRTSTISVVDAATTPMKPYSPNILADVGIGFFGGAALGMAFALIRSRTNSTFQSPGEAPTHLQVRELGVIPSMRGGGFGLLRWMRPESVVDIKPSGEVLPPRASEASHVVKWRMPARSMALATWLNSPAISEAFFGAVNSLLVASSEGSEGRVIVLTSPDAGDGKTTVATNVATALAQIGRRVVLIDGDLRKPRLHSIFDESPEHGLAEFLEGDDQAAKRLLPNLIRDTKIPNLYVVPTRSVRDGAFKKLHSSRLRALLAQLRSEFDVVIVDTPPMRHISDARVYGRMADGVVLVFRAGKTTRESALAVYDCLFQDGIRVFGTILNDWNPSKGDRFSAYSSYFRAAS